MESGHKGKTCSTIRTFFMCTILGMSAASISVSAMVYQLCTLGPTLSAKPCTVKASLRTATKKTPARHMQIFLWVIFSVRRRQGCQNEASAVYPEPRLISQVKKTPHVNTSLRNVSKGGLCWKARVWAGAVHLEPHYISWISSTNCSAYQHASEYY